jgi:MiaB-like tRNA modifying enzyme
MSNKSVLINKVLSKKSSKTLVCIKTFGCSINHSDSEVMAGLLQEAGYDVINSYSGEVENNDTISDTADAIIINTCSVKNLAESKFFRELRKWQDKDVKIIVAGCIPQAEPELLNTKLKDVSVIGTRQLVHVVDILKETLNGEIIHNINNDKNDRLNLPKIRKTGIIEILPISEGCLSSCTYCKTKLARGNLLSYPKEKIIKQFKAALADGCKEFWITSQDNGCYGFDIYRKEKYFLPQLLNDLLSIDGEFRIRLGMSNPDHVDRIKNELVETFKHAKMYKFLHIPIQSGNDRVLKSMKRCYTVKEFNGIIDLFRREIPEITISTDIIVGFPDEADREFEDTVKLVKHVNFDVLNLSRFWLRKGTEAESMKQLYSAVIKKRAEYLKKLFDGLSENNNKKFLNKEFTVLIDELGRHDSLIARDEYYKHIVIKNSTQNYKIGDFVKVKISSITRYDLVGEVIEKV